MIEQIRANAEMVVAQMREISEIDFGYNEDSVEWLQGYIERRRESGQFENAETKSKLISVLGSYLGECIVQCHGGNWRQTEFGWGVELSKDNVAFPFAKVQKQIENGLEDGIASFFNVIPTVFGPDTPEARPARPWWKVW